MTNQLIISDITIHKDSEGRYSLNDLHQASGGERKYEPAGWLRLDQTNELIQEILNTQICVFKPVDSRKGRYGGTYVCKELVYAYAMWISAAFALKVIRAYDVLIAGSAKGTRFETLPGKITLEQQNAIKELVKSRADTLSGDKRAKAAITMWSALKSHFGTTYKEIEETQFTEALSLVARIPLEGELLARTDISSNQRPSAALNLPEGLNYSFLTVVQNGQVAYIRLAQKGEHFMSVATSMEMAQRAGYVIIHCDELESITLTDLAKRTGEAQQLMKKWARTTPIKAGV